MAGLDSLQFGSTWRPPQDGHLCPGLQPASCPGPLASAATPCTIVLVTSSMSLMAFWFLGLQLCTWSVLHLKQSSWNSLLALQLFFTSPLNLRAGCLASRGIPQHPAFTSSIHSSASITSHHENRGTIGAKMTLK